MSSHPSCKCERFLKTCFFLNLFFSDTTLDLRHLERMLRNRTLNLVNGLNADDLDLNDTAANETITAGVLHALSDQVQNQPEMTQSAVKRTYWFDLGLGVHPASGAFVALGVASCE